MQPPIADYGLIGDTRTAALCSRAGSIDWFCLPRFDSEPVFSRLIHESGSRFSISPVGRADTMRRYLDFSSVLETTWRDSSGAARLSEGMVSEVSGELLPQALLVRALECLSGEFEAEIVFDARYGLANEPFQWKQRHGALLGTKGPLALALQTEPALSFEPGKPHRMLLRSGERLILVLSAAYGEPVVLVNPAHAASLLDRTRAWWEDWASTIEYEGPAREAVVRSLLTLRLLTYSPSGAPVASPTTSLPERVGGDRNWDYRYAWPRDASIGVGAFLGAGKRREAEVFLSWLTHATRLSRPRLDPVYTIDGRPVPEEREIAAASGFRGSVPVRVGNMASGQHQLDVYGWVVDAAHQMAGSGEVDGGVLAMVGDFADYVCENWRQPDASIWEHRNDGRHWVQSKLMAWLALERAIAVAGSRSSRRQRESWSTEREAIAREIKARGWDDGRRSYLRAYESHELDAALLSPALLVFEKDGGRLASSVQAVREALGAGGPLLYRYSGADREEGAFLPCSFWLVQALVALGRLDEAARLFEDACALSNDVGLLPEEIHPASGDFLGNLPLAFTHATLVQAALDLQAKLKR